VDLVKQCDVKSEYDGVFCLKLSCIFTSIYKNVPFCLFNCIKFNSVCFWQHKGLLWLDLVNLSFCLRSLEKHLLSLVLIISKLSLQSHFEGYSVCEDKQR